MIWGAVCRCGFSHIYKSNRNDPIDTQTYTPSVSLHLYSGHNFAIQCSNVKILNHLWICHAVCGMVDGNDERTFEMMRKNSLHLKVSSMWSGIYLLYNVNVNVSVCTNSSFIFQIKRVNTEKYAIIIHDSSSSIWMWWKSDIGKKSTLFNWLIFNSLDQRIQIDERDGQWVFMMLVCAICCCTCSTRFSIFVLLSKLNWEFMSFAMRLSSFERTINRPQIENKLRFYTHWPFFLFRRWRWCCCYSNGLIKSTHDIIIWSFFPFRSTRLICFVFIMW